MFICSSQENFGVNNITMETLEEKKEEAKIEKKIEVAVDQNGKQNGILKDLGVAGGGVIFFYLILILAKWVDGKFGLAEAYTLVDIASVSLHVAIASALTWVIKRVVFPKTLGAFFGTMFNIGWGEFTVQEKTRWSLATFLVIFATIMFASK